MRDRPSRYSQSGRILKVLEQRRAWAADEGDEETAWVSTHELIYGYHIPGIIHSRISELRRDYGFEIEHRKEGNDGARSHQYRLTLQEQDGVTASAPPALGAPADHGDSGVPLDLRVAEEETCRSVPSEALTQVYEHPTERAEATKTPEVRRGWEQPRHPEPMGDGGHDQDGDTGATTEGVRAEAHREQDGGGNPGSAPTAALTLFGDERHMYERETA